MQNLIEIATISYLSSSLQCLFGRDEKDSLFCAFLRADFELFCQKLDSSLKMLRFDFLVIWLTGKCIRSVVDDKDVGMGQSFRDFVEESLK